MTIWLTSSQLRCVNPSLDYLWLVYLAFCHINNSVLVPLPWSRKSKSRSHLESVDAAGVAGVGDGLSRTHGGILLGDGHDCAGRCGWRGCTSQLAVNKVGRIWKTLIIFPHLAFIARKTHFTIQKILLKIRVFTNWKLKRPVVNSNWMVMRCFVL